MNAIDMLVPFAPHLIDSYKYGHVDMYPPGTTRVYSNFTARSNRHRNTVNVSDYTVFVGLQATLKALHAVWNETFFSRPKSEVIKKYKRRMNKILGTNVESVTHIEKLHDLGYLPIEVRALPEGSKVHLKVPYFTVENTHPDFYWLTNYLEDFFSAQSWKMINNATLAHDCRLIIEHHFKQTGADMNMVKFFGHDFAFRGMSGIFDGASTAFAHLTSFVGSDAVSGVDFAEDVYGANVDEELVSASVPATEHSTQTATIRQIINSPDFKNLTSEFYDRTPGGYDGKKKYSNELIGEYGLFKRLLEQYPTGILSVVSDSYDFFGVLTEILPRLKDEIMGRDGKLVLRPDSGNPVDIICGEVDFIKADSEIDALKKLNENFLKEWEGHAIRNATYLHVGKFKISGEYFTISAIYLADECPKNPNKLEIIERRSVEVKKIVPKPHEIGAVQCLYNVFGGTPTSTGHITLDGHVGLIYGDSINASMMDEILTKLSRNGFSAQNVVYGIGSYSYNMSSRDSWGMAMKATWVEINKVSTPIYKQPKTGDGLKNSAYGRLKVTGSDGKYTLVDQSDISKYNSAKDVMKTVYRDGVFHEVTTLNDIRTRLYGDKF